MATGTGRAARADPSVRRIQILDAAVDVFGRQGYRNASLRDVAEAVGLTVQGVLHYFPSKEDLLLEVLEHRSISRSARFAEIEQGEGALALMRHLLAENLKAPGQMRLYITVAAEAADPEHPAHQYFVNRYALTHSRFRELAARDIALGRLRRDAVASEVAEEVIALADGLQLQYLLRPELDLLAAFDRAVARFRI